MTEKKKATKKLSNNKAFCEGNQLAKNLSREKQARAVANREERLYKKIDKDMVARYLTLNSHYTLEELKERLKHRANMSMLEYMIVRVMVRCAQDGDHHRLDFLMDRLIGKVPQKIRHSVDDPYESYTEEELMAMKKKLEKENRYTAKQLEKLHKRTPEEQAAIEAEYTKLEQENLN